MPVIVSESPSDAAAATGLLQSGLTRLHPQRNPPCLHRRRVPKDRSRIAVDVRFRRTNAFPVLLNGWNASDIFASRGKCPSARQADKVKHSPQTANRRSRSHHPNPPSDHVRQVAGCAAVNYRGRASFTFLARLSSPMESRRLPGARVCSGASGGGVIGRTFGLTAGLRAGRKHCSGCRRGATIGHRPAAP
jgi:hypothetical protein